MNGRSVPGAAGFGPVSSLKIFGKAARPAEFCPSWALTLSVKKPSTWAVIVEKSVNGGAADRRAEHSKDRLHLPRRASRSCAVRRLIPRLRREAGYTQIEPSVAWTHRLHWGFVLSHFSLRVRQAVQEKRS